MPPASCCIFFRLQVLLVLPKGLPSVVPSPPPASYYVPLRLWVLRGQDSAALCQHTSGEAEEPVSQQGEGLPAPICFSARAQANQQLQPVSDRGRQAIDFRKPGRP